MRIVNKEEAQSPLEVLEGDSVTLVARLSPETAAVQWQKDGQMLRSGGRLLVCSEGPTRSLTIKQAELGDSGIFLCDAGDDEVHFTLHVKGEAGGVPHPWPGAGAVLCPTPGCFMPPCHGSAASGGTAEPGAPPVQKRPCCS